LGNFHRPDVGNAYRVDKALPGRAGNKRAAQPSAWTRRAGRPRGLVPRLQRRRYPVTILKALMAVSFAVAMTQAAGAVDISGAGATFPYPVYAKWADAYKKETNVGLNYQSIGSGGGIKQIKARTVTFGATDAPLTGKDLDDSGLAQFPMVMGGIVPVVNLDGVKPGDLTIDGPTLAKIFLGEIKTWDDAAIKTLNPNAKLPAQAIAIVHRSDGSGTTFNFTYYLSDVSSDWKSKVGTNTAVEWPGGIGAKGNEGVANNVANTKGSIGYVEYAYALQNKLTFTKMVNMAGKTVVPTSEAFQAAAANADWKSQPGYGVILANQPGERSWPMTAATWILIYKKPANAAATGEALKFFAWAYAKGGKMAEDLDYVPMPSNVVADIEKMWAAEIKDASGKPLFAVIN
jgi:phosphate transport system substrate-binding protein